MLVSMRLQVQAAQMCWPRWAVSALGGCCQELCEALLEEVQLLVDDYAGNKVAALCAALHTEIGSAGSTWLRMICGASCACPSWLLRVTRLGRGTPEACKTASSSA